MSHCWEKGDKVSSESDIHEQGNFREDKTQDTFREELIKQTNQRVHTSTCLVNDQNLADGAKTGEHINKEDANKMRCNKHSLREQKPFNWGIASGRSPIMSRLWDEGMGFL